MKRFQACRKKPCNACCLTSSASFLGRQAVDDGDSCELLLPPYGLDWMFVYVMRGFPRARKRSLLLSVFTFEPNPFHQTVTRTHVVICVRLLCSSWCPILHFFCLHLKVSCKRADRQNANQEHNTHSFTFSVCFVASCLQSERMPNRHSCTSARKRVHGGAAPTAISSSTCHPFRKLHHTLCSNDT